jgi:transcriptional regulator with XRE-family HTH domain
LTAFSKNLRKLREDKKISQKAAAASLGVSQALLSHYEKGIRECGLDFLARAAKYYGVTADFMLGISGMIPEKPENDFENEILNEFKDDEARKDGIEINTYSVLYKNLIINALTYIFGRMKNVKYRDASILSGKYLSLEIYRLCGILFGGIERPENLSERHIIMELKYILGIENMQEAENCLGQYNFDNPYLNNIIKSMSLE